MTSSSDVYEDEVEYDDDVTDDVGEAASVFESGLGDEGVDDVTSVAPFEINEISFGNKNKTSRCNPTSDSES